MRSTLIISGLAAASLTLAATADITSVGLVSYSVTAEEFGGASVTVNVQDLYLYSDNAADVALNVYDLTLAEAARATYYQSATGAGWAPTNLGGMFDTSATRLADSFVTIGGFMQDMLIPEQAPGMGAGTGLDPNFGGNGSPYPNAFAGWYNGSPPESQRSGRHAPRYRRHGRPHRSLRLRRRLRPRGFDLVRHLERGNRHRCRAGDLHRRSRPERLRPPRLRRPRRSSPSEWLIPRRTHGTVGSNPAEIIETAPRRDLRGGGRFSRSPP